MRAEVAEGPLKQQKQLVSYFLISIQPKWPKGIILLGDRVEIQRTCVSSNQLRGETDNRVCIQGELQVEPKVIKYTLV